MNSDRIPFIGADVHFVAPNGEHIAGKVTAIQQGRVKTPDGVEQNAEVVVLTLFHLNGLQFGQAAIEDQIGKVPGSWHWTERPSRLVGRNGARLMG